MNDGGPAFPGEWFNSTGGNVLWANGEVVPPENMIKFRGMSLREWIAGLALAAMMANKNSATAEILLDREYCSCRARSACKLADALIAELAKQS